MPIRYKRDAAAQRHFIREWRKYRSLTLEQLAGRLDISVASLSRLERGDQSYTQPVLEALAEALQCEPADLIMRDPESPVWSIVDTLKALTPAQQEQVVQIIETFKKAS